MKKILLGAVLFISLGVIGFIKLEAHPFVEDDALIHVTLSYKEVEKDFEVEPYSELSEIIDEIELDDDANLDAINKYQVLKHKDKIIIPLKTEEACISINHANKESLMLIKGIGPAMADRIIEYRNENGYFQKIEEIQEVKGIGEKTFEKMKAQLCI